MKRTSFWFWAALIPLALIPSSSAEVVKHDDALAWISGKVRFERREGVAPLAGNTISYWSVVVQGKDAGYELAQVFALGEARAPESVNLKGVDIRAGTQVAIEGRVQSIRKNFGLLSEVGRVKVISEREVAAEYPGWICGTEDGETPHLSVSVWFETQATPAEYWLRVWGDDDQAVNGRTLGRGHLLAMTRHSDFQALADEVLWKGSSEDSSLRLSIARRPGRTSRLPGVLRLMDRELRLLCRLIPGYAGPID